MERSESDDPSVVGEPLETEDGVRVPAQQNVGAGVEEGGGEWPDPNTPPQPPAPGAADDGENSESTGG
jgi:uncharacterized spore protein YtfJ